MGLGIGKLTFLRGKCTSVQEDIMPKPKSWTGFSKAEKCWVCLSTSVSELHSPLLTLEV